MHGPLVRLATVVAQVQTPMDTSPTKARTGRAAVALATIAPLIVVVLATPGTMMIGEQYGTDALPFVFGCLVCRSTRVRYRAQSGLTP